MNLPPRGITWSTPAFTVCLVVLGTASVFGAWLSARGGEEMLDSPMVVYTVGVLTVLCGVAGGVAPLAGPYWGLVVAVPYLGAFVVEEKAPVIGADLGFIGFGMLLAGMTVPWLAGFAVGQARTRR